MDGKEFSDAARASIFMKTTESLGSSETVKGFEFDKDLDYHKLLQSFHSTGFQATNFAKAVEEVNKMISKKEEPWKPNADCVDSETPQTSCTIYLAYTSNMISCGVREVIRFLVQHKMVDVLVSTAGGIEEDFIKCLAPTHIGDFHLSGSYLRERGINRIGNLVIANDNYCMFENWISPILDKMLEEQKQGVNWTPSKMIARLGKEINNPESVYYWAYKNNIPVFSPALTDGSIGDILYFNSIRNPELRLDIIEDIRRMNHLTVRSTNTGMIILGGGVVKHHTCNSNAMRNGANYSVYINTGIEYDGSDSGAPPDEAVSWGKIRRDATPVKVYGEASILFPLLVAETFARRHHKLD